jgi:hypothetical protein
MAVGLGIEPPDPMPEGASSDGHREVRGDFTVRLFDLRRV